MNARAMLGCCTIAVLAGCGGGGGAADPKSVTISAHTPEAIAFSAYAYNAGNWYETVYATIEGADPRKLHFASVVTGTAVQYIYSPDVDDDGSTVMVTVGGTIASYLCPGTYTGEITFHVCTTPTCAGGEVTGSPFTIPVTYEVTGFWPDLPRPAPSFSIGSLHFGLGQDPTEADRRRTFRVGSSHGGTWTATSDVAWLSVDPASASGGPVTVTAALDAGEVDGLANGAHTGKITFDDGPSSFTVPVDLTINRSFAGSELLEDGTFSSGLLEWEVQANGEVVETSTAGEVFKLTPVALSSANMGDVTLVPREAVLLRAGRHYRVAFDAWADAPTKLGVLIGGGDTYSSRNFILGTTPQHFDDVVVLEEDVSQGGIRFYLGGNATPLYLDNVSFHEVP